MGSDGGMGGMCMGGCNMGGCNMGGQMHLGKGTMTGELNINKVF